MSNVSIYVVDLKRVSPLGGSGATHSLAGQVHLAGGGSAGGEGSGNFKQGQHVRRSFVREKPGEMRAR